MTTHSIILIDSPGGSDITFDYEIYFVDASDGPITLTLPDTFDGVSFVVKRIDTVTDNIVIIKAEGGKLIDGRLELELQSYDNVTLTHLNNGWYNSLGTGNHNIESCRTVLELNDSNFNLTMVHLKRGIITIPATGTKTLTLPAASDAVADESDTPDVRKNTSIDFSIINTGLGSVTLSTQLGVDIVGKQTVSNSTSGLFRIIFTNISSSNEAYTVYRLA